ncbi:GNAT family N-acetyltransferase [Clostridium botulinum]|uniref:GNAT family N-acetyltransferase n=1 Tax=Clostridium botulinum TaxID=1491 RepID=UPI001748670B|nr:GNAT family N-acetyltransferase [Clostridium botulinum]MBD5639337.1 GNAT family N-acetyltransferase [Clostridium botulinum]
MEIRVATKNNIEDICRLYDELFSDMGSLQPTYFKSAEQDKAFLESIISSEKSDILIAVDNNESIIGFALVQEQETPPFSCLVKHRYAYLMDMIKKRPYRGKGIGTTLIDEVKKWSENRNLEYVELNVLPENINAIKLYEKQEFKNVMQTMFITFLKFH